ncbi:MAG: cyanophycinase [Candidatus Sericytochromatia bacterium]
MKKVFLLALLGTFLSANSNLKKNILNNKCEYKSYLIGNSKDVTTKTEPLFVLMGGGDDVDQAFNEMVKSSGGGDFVILRSSGEDGYNSYVYHDIGAGRVDSVETLLIDSKEKANCNEVEQKIRNAEAVFIAGGDQADYYNYWHNSKVESALNYLINKKYVPIGGTSAGLAILGKFVFTAEKDTITSEEALKNPFDEKIIIRNNFLSVPLLDNIITDTHFSQRERQGRLITFMNNILLNKLAPFNKIKAVGVDEKTVVVLNKDGIGKVFGSNYAEFFSLGTKPSSFTPFNWEPKDKNYAIKSVKVKGSKSGTNSFNFNTWKLQKGTSEEVKYSIDKGVLKRN